MNAIRLIETDSSNIAPIFHQNAESLVNEINWFVQTVNNRLVNYFGEEKIIIATDKTRETVSLKEEVQYIDVVPPDLANDHSVYAEFVKYYQLSSNERLILMLSLVPHVQPQLLDVFFSVNKS